MHTEQLSTDNAHSAQPANVVAEVRNLTKSFKGKVALKNLCLTIRSGQVLAVLGANGAGKTTLINILMGRLQADSGDVQVFGLPPGCPEAKSRPGQCCRWRPYRKP